MHTDTIKEFIITANPNGCGNPNVRPTDEPDSSQTITYADDGWKCQDNADKPKATLKYAAQLATNKE